MTCVRPCFLLLFATVHFAAGTWCPSPCVCSDTEADCTKAHLTEFPNSRFDKYLRKVDFSYNDISTVGNYDIRNWMIVSLIDLNVSNNAIRILDENSFIGQSRLEELDLSSNGLEHIPVNIFTYVPNLKWLSLANNKLKIPDNALFLQNANLEVLHLDNCGLSGISLSSFVDLANLRELYLSHNKIETFATGSVTYSQKLTKIQYLELSHNKLKVVPQALTELQRLEEVNLRHNELKNFSDFSVMTRQLKVLYINPNPWACGCGSCDFGMICGRGNCAVDVCETQSDYRSSVDCVVQNSTSTVNESSISEVVLGSDSSEFLQESTFIDNYGLLVVCLLCAVSVVLFFVVVRELCKRYRRMPSSVTVTESAALVDVTSD